MDPELHDALAQLSRLVDLRFTALDAGMVETRRHFDVVAEGLQADLRLVAEGVTGLAQRVDRLETTFHEDLLGVQRELGAMIRFSYAELDRRVQTLEGRLTEVETRLHRLEVVR